MMIKKFSVFLLTLILLVSLAPAAMADDWYLDPGGFYTVNTQEGQMLFTYAGQITVDDEYISSDNKRYRVVEVDDSRRVAIARFVEDVVLWEGYDATMLTNVSAQQAKKKVALYCTHTDESFIPGDGSEAKPDHGGIVDVANTLCDALKKRGVDATVDDTSHDPHDAGAYRRSRSSAMNLMESVRPDLLLDIHRDGVPDPKEYDDTIKGTQASKCRFVIGRSNQNKAANEETAKKIKQVADTAYPGLVKDIFIGHGSYNQDLTPNSMIIEIGTHTIEKQRVIETTGYIADVLAQYLGVSQAQGNQSGQPQGQGLASGQPQVQQQGATQPGDNRTAAGSIAWIIGIVGGACLIFLLIATVSGQRRERVGNFFKEVTGMGKHRDKDK
jgi:stage II sporulation protein P